MIEIPLNYIECARIHVNHDEHFKCIIECFICCSNFDVWSSFEQHLCLHKDHFNDNELQSIENNLEDNDVQELCEEVEEEIANFQQNHEEGNSTLLELGTGDWKSTEMSKLNTYIDRVLLKPSISPINAEESNAMLSEPEGNFPQEQMELLEHFEAEIINIKSPHDDNISSGASIKMTKTRRRRKKQNKDNNVDMDGTKCTSSDNPRFFFQFSTTPTDIMLDLIDCIRRYDCQWNVQHPHFLIREKHEESAAQICQVMAEHWNLEITPKIMRRSILHLRRWFELEYVRSKTDKNYECRHLIYYTKLLEFMPHSHLHVFICDECKRKFRSEDLLLQHKHVAHNAAKPHACKYCDCSFVHLSQLRVHENRHTKRVMWKCAQCDYLTSSKSDYRSHLTAHSDIRSYVCNICDSSYKSSTSLAVHRRKHEPPTLECDYCKKMFYEKYRLKRHLRLKHENSLNPFSCDLCSKNFQSAKSLSFHRNIHEEEKQQHFSGTDEVESSQNSVTVMPIEMNIWHAENVPIYGGEV